MKYALFPVLLMLCAGCGTLASSGAASMDEVVPESAAARAMSAAMSTEVVNDDSSMVQAGRLPETRTPGAAVRETFAADMPETAFSDGDRREVSLLPTEPGAEPGHETAYETPPALEAECVSCQGGLRWFERSGFLDYMVPVLFDLIDWGGGKLMRALSGDKAKSASSSRKSGGRSARETDRKRSKRKPNKNTSRGRGRR